MKNKIRIIPLGSDANIGANSYYIDWKGKYSILLDCGSNENADTFENRPDFNKADSKFDFIIISHVHNDHIGSLPFAYEYFLEKNGKIIMHKDNKNIITDILIDSGKIYGKQNHDPKVKKQIYSDASISLYKKENIEKMVDNIVFIDYEKTFKIGDLEIILFNAGHVIGSSSIYLNDGENSIFYTGDFNDTQTFIHKPINIPENLNVDILITETTNLNKNKNLTIEEKTDEFAKYVNKSFKNNGHILVPAFALGRTQEVLLCLENAKNKNLIDKSIEYYLSIGLADVLTKKYSEMINIPKYNVLNFNKAIEQIPKNAVIIGTSGFFSRGSIIRDIAEKLKTDQNTTIIFPSSYASESKNVEEFQKNAKCNVVDIDFSAHASKEGIENIINKLNPKFILLIHGNYEYSIKFLDKYKNVIIPSFKGEEIIVDFKNNRIIQSSKKDTFIITVGKSTVSNNQQIEIKDLTTAKKKSAEINTFLSIDEKLISNKENIIINLIATKGSSPSAKIISEYLENIGYTTIISVNDINIENLTQLVKEGKSADMSDIISQMSRIIYRYNKTSFVISGGYKIIISVSYMLANVFGCPAYYKNENMDPIKDLSIPVQVLPIHIDTNIYELYADKIDKILFSKTEVSKNIYKMLPENIKALLYFNKDRYLFTNLGTIMRYISEIKNKLLKDFNKKLDKIDILKEEEGKVKQFFKTLYENGYIEDIIFEREISLNNKLYSTKEIKIKFLSKTSKYIKYQLEFETASQNFKIRPNINFKNNIEILIGKEKIF